MKFIIAEEHYMDDDDCYCFIEYDTENLTKDEKTDIFYSLIEGNSKIVQISSPSPENIGSELFHLLELNKIKKEETKKKRSEAAKKAWVRRKAVNI